jgi:hypothetical protein
MAFNAMASQLAVASEKGTIHVFNLNDSVSQTTVIPPLLRSILPKYFSPGRSFAQVHLREGKAHITFLPDHQNVLAVVRFDGLYYKYMFDHERGGEAVMMDSKVL